MVRAMEPDVDEGGGGPQDAWQPGPAHDAVGGAVSFEKAVDVGMVPAGMAELHAHPDPGRHCGKKVVQPGVVPCEIRRQLHEQHCTLLTQLVPAPGNALDPDFRAIELPAMSQTARSLDR